MKSFLIWYNYNTNKRNIQEKRNDQFMMPNIWLIGVFGKEDEESSGKTIKDKVPNSPSKLTGEANLILI